MESRKDNGPFNIFAEAETIIEFYDLDPLNVVWHGNYINYFEIGRSALLAKINYDYNEMANSGYAWPVVDISLKYRRPLHFKDRIRIKAILMEYENCLIIKYEIIKVQTGEITTRGVSTQMAFNIEAGDSCFVSPAILIERVEAFIREQRTEGPQTENNEDSV